MKSKVSDLDAQMTDLKALAQSLNENVKGLNSRIEDLYETEEAINVDLDSKTQ